MAFKSQSSLSAEYELVKATARALKNRAQSMRDTLAAFNVPLAQIINDLLPDLRTAQARFATVKPGLADYAKAQENDPAYDVAAEFIALRTEIDSTIAWLVANAPASPHLEERTLNPDGTVTLRTLSPAQTAGLRTQLDALIATID